MATRGVWTELSQVLAAADGIIRIHDEDVEVLDERALRESLVDDLIWNAVFGEDPVRSAARWIIRRAAVAVGAYPASIHEVYTACGRGEYAHATAPAMNIRGMAYDSMRAAFRAAKANDVGIMLFELARSEMGYTEQRPGEYASNALAAAIREGHRGPVFVQGDHYQISAKKYVTAERDAELQTIRDLCVEAMAAGYYNIDVDASTSVDLSLPTLSEQQQLNARHTAELTRFIRENEPAGVTVSIGGEIGEVGLRNSTVEDLRAFMELYEAHLARHSAEAGRTLTGISKISVQTGTSHGGIVLPDGTIQRVAVDFQTLHDLSVAAREYGMGGAVQHGASTLPAEYFDEFAKSGAVEVHLAAAFQNIIMDSPNLPAALREKTYGYLQEKYGNERKEGQSDAQFFYAVRKWVHATFKHDFWSMADENRDAIAGELEATFSMLMQRLNVTGTRELVARLTPMVDVRTAAPGALRAALRGERIHAGGGKETYELHDEGE